MTTPTHRLTVTVEVTRPGDRDAYIDLAAALSALGDLLLEADLGQMFTPDGRSATPTVAGACQPTDPLDPVMGWTWERLADSQLEDLAAYSADPLPGDAAYPPIQAAGTLIHAVPNGNLPAWRSAKNVWELADAFRAMTPAERAELLAELRATTPADGSQLVITVLRTVIEVQD
jgi:hypothetical protein